MLASRICGAFRTQPQQRQQLRHASYTVEVYLVKDVKKLGRAGMVVDVQPGYARNYLVRSGLAVYMGEGPWRKVLPEVSKAGTHDALKLTPRAIGEEIRQLLMTTPETVDQYIVKRATPASTEPTPDAAV